jgi:uncharacterized delta-60 repeat protein
MDMKKGILMALMAAILTCSGVLEAKWARTYGGSKNEVAYSVQQTSDEGYIVAGQTESFGAGVADFWILKLSQDGNVEWERAYGGKREDIAYCIRQTTDGGYIVAGQTESFSAGGDDYLVLKLDKNGNIQWQKTYGGIYDDRALSVCESHQGGYLVGGHTGFGAGVWDFWVLKLDTEGRIQWQYTYGGKETEYLRSMQQTDDGGYILAGTTATFFKGDLYNIWVVKIASDGIIEWERSFGGFEPEWGYSIVQTEDGGYIVAGDKFNYTDVAYDFWILKLSPNGKIQWQHTYGKGKQDIAYNIAQTEDGGYVVSGFTESSGMGNEDIWVMKLKEDGSVDWQRTYGGTQIDRARAMALTNDGGCIVAGETKSYGAGRNDIWVMKLGPDGNIDPACGFIRQTDVQPEVGKNALEGNSTATTTAPSVSPAVPAVSTRQTTGLTFLLCEAPRFRLTIVATTGGSTQPSPGSYHFYKGTEKQILAIPDSYHTFSRWSGNVPPNDINTNPLTLMMTRDRTITAHFDPLLLPPLDFSGYRVMNRSLSQAEYIHVLTWKPNPSNLNVERYRIYLDQGGSWNILAKLPGTSTVFWHRKIVTNEPHSYSITAVDNEGMESAGSTISVNQNTRSLKKEHNARTFIQRGDLTWILTLRMLF